MKANELRINNLVDRVDYICNVKAIDEDGVILEPINYKGEVSGFQELKPIKLNKKWLVKLGFKHIGKNDYAIDVSFDTQLIICSGLHFIFQDVFDIKIFTTFSGRKIQYVHQLQNLYFALTGEELKIEL